jgi:hypothetical protein
MVGAKRRIIYSVEMDQGGDRWQAILHTDVFGHAQVIAEDARAGGAKVRVTEEADPAGVCGARERRFRLGVQEKAGSETPVHRLHHVKAAAS